MILWQLRLGLFFISVWQNIRLSNACESEFFCSSNKALGEWQAEKDYLFSMRRGTGWGGRSYFGLCYSCWGEWTRARPLGAMPLWKKRRGHQGGGSQNVRLYSDCDTAGVGHLELWGCTDCSVIVCAESIRQGMTPLYRRTRDSKVFQEEEVTVPEIISVVFLHCPHGDTSLAADRSICPELWAPQRWNWVACCIHRVGFDEELLLSLEPLFYNFLCPWANFPHL